MGLNFIYSSERRQSSLTQLSEINVCDTGEIDIFVGEFEIFVAAVNKVIVAAGNILVIRG